MTGEYKADIRGLIFSGAYIRGSIQRARGEVDY